MTRKNLVIFVDGDACPVTDEILKCASGSNCPVTFVHSYAHMRKDSFPSFVKVIITDPDREAVDLAICNNAKKGDVVITQDLGLAALLLAKEAIVLTPRGTVIDNRQTDFLLDKRHSEGKKRRAGQKTKGPAKITAEDKRDFMYTLEKILSKKQEI